MAEERLCPRGEERADLRAGIVASVMANAYRDRKQRLKPYTHEDFMPKFGPPEERPVMSVEAMCRMAEAITLAYGGEVRKRGDDSKPGGQADRKRDGVHAGPG